MTANKVRWGILGTARIAETAFIPALRQTRRGQLVAVASRSQEKADAFAKQYDIPLAFADYATMLASDEIDAVYNPLPNTMHAEWTAVAADYGKPIFCEKPLAVSPQEGQAMVDKCRAAGVLLVEAFIFLCHPQTLKLRQLLDDGAIGELRQVQAHFTFHMSKPEGNIRLNKDLGGGSLFDAGVYPITYTRFAFDQDPIAIQAAARIDPNYAVDTRASAILTFAGDRYATIQAGFDTMGGPGVTLFGDTGYIHISQPYHPRDETQFTVHTKSGEEAFAFNAGPHPFQPAIEHFHDCLLDGVESRMAADKAIGTLRTVEAILESAKTGERITF